MTAHFGKRNSENSGRLVRRMIVSVSVTLAWICGWPTLAHAQSMREHYMAGEQAYAQQRYDDAITAFEKVVELDPNFAPVYNALGLVYRDLDTRLEDVIWFFKVAAEIDPNFIQAYDNMCKTYFQANVFDLAEKTCLQALAVDPDYGSAEMTLAWTYLAGKSQPADAVYYFQKVLGKVQSPVIYYGLGLAYSMQGDSAHALEVITQLRQLGKDEMASQVENTLRGATQPVVEVTPQYAAPGISVPSAPLPASAPAGQIVSSRPAPPAADETSGTSGGSMRIRLRGQLTGGASAQAPAPQAAAQPAASSSDSSTLGSHTAGESAVDRIRRLQQLRYGIGGGTTIKGSGY